MLDFAWGFLARAAVMIPTIVLVTAAAWMLFRRFGKSYADVPFDARNLRTWPLPYALADAVAFGVVYAAASAALGENDYANAISGAAAAIVAVGIVPLLFVAPAK